MNKKDETSSTERDIWARRKAALLEIVKEVIPTGEEDLEVPDDLKVDVSPESPWLWELFQPVYASRQRETCRRLWKPLVEFAERAAVFLEESYSSEEKYSRRYLWRVLLNELSTDLGIIQAAFRQRNLKEVKQPENEKSREVSSHELINPQASTLFMADIISEHALGQAVANGYLKQTPIITYLKENISIRPIPYADVMLISVAYASMLGSLEINSFRRVSRDMLAIPHEVGHHLFWKGQMPRMERSVREHLLKRLNQNQIWEWDWRRAWLEEIFADAYGLLVAGPVMALSFQDLLTDNLPSSFREDTGHHPIPALRPYIQTRILRGITDASGNPLYPVAPKLLDEEWEEELAVNSPKEWTDVSPLEVEYKRHGIAQPIKGQRILDELDEMIRIVLWTLRGQRPSGAGANWTHGSWNAWTTDVQNNKELLRLFDNLTFKNFPPKSRPLLKPDDSDQANGSKNWMELIGSGWSVKGPEDDSG
jgi:hypothetical protein